MLTAVTDLENFKCSIIIFFYTDAWIEIKGVYNSHLYGQV